MMEKYAVTAGQSAANIVTFPIPNSAPIRKHGVRMDILTDAMSNDVLMNLAYSCMIRSYTVQARKDPEGIALFNLAYSAYEALICEYARRTSATREISATMPSPAPKKNTRKKV